MSYNKITFDYDEIEKLYTIDCTDQDIADHLGISRKTVQRRKKNDKKWQKAMRYGYAKGNRSLRAKQYQVALSGNTTMLVWLGKNRLGQTDKQEFNHQEVDNNAFVPPKTFADLYED